VAYLAGDDELDVVHDPDRPFLQTDLYSQRVTWCPAASVTTVGDLMGRVASRERFVEDWVTGCEAASGG